MDSSPIEVQRADALYDVLEMPTNTGQVGQYALGRVLGGKLGWRFRDTRIPS